MKKTHLVAVLLLVVMVAYLASRNRDYEWHLPTDMPAPVVPAENPMNAAKIELGRWLFYDVRLSGNGTMSCATCHIQALAFTDGKPRSIGSTGEAHPRSSMSLVNVAYASRLTWANPLLDRLEDQALTPLFGDSPVEMGLGGFENVPGELLRDDPRYKALARDAFPGERSPHSTVNAIRAIAAFVRTIVSFDSPYDRYLAGDETALSGGAIRGMALFFSEKVECFHCHGGFNFTDSSTHANARIEQVGFHNTGLYNVGTTGAYPPDNTGLYDMTGVGRDMGRFKAPTLRNIALTAPYMHDGSVTTLEAAIDHYSRGGRLTTDGPYAGDGRLSPFKSEFVNGFELSAEEKADLLDFLHALTDESILTNDAWSDPFSSPSP